MLLWDGLCLLLYYSSSNAVIHLRGLLLCSILHECTQKLMYMYLHVEQLHVCAALLVFLALRLPVATWNWILLG